LELLASNVKPQVQAALLDAPIHEDDIPF
jgi:hypothetical protein